MKSTLLLLTFIACAALVAQEPENKQEVVPSIQGAWLLSFPDGAKRTKFIADGRWTITQADPKSGAVVFHHGGSYTFDGKTYVEKVEFANPSTVSLIGKEHTFELTVEGDMIHQKGIGNPWTEDWQRIKPE